MDSGGQEQNYWPGFVDALSNVVLTLIFVLVVFVFALSMASSKIEKRMQEVTHAAATQQQEQATGATELTSRENAKLRQQVEVLQEEIAQLRAKKPVASETQGVNMDITVEGKTDTGKASGVVAMKQTEDELILSYPTDVADMNDPTMAQLNKGLDALQKKIGKHTILLRASVGTGSYSAQQRLAYYRIMTVRNYLMSKGYGDNTTITSKIVPSDTPDIGHVEIIFERQQ